MQGKVLIQKSERSKVIKIVLSGIILILSGYLFFNMTNPSPFYMMYPGIAVLAIGIIDILKGIFTKKNSKTTRSIEIGVGITAIVVGFFIFVVFQDDIISRSSSLFFLFMIIRGVGFIGEGITQRHRAKVIRTLTIMIGIIFMILSGLFKNNPDMSYSMISGLLSLNLLLIGIEIIVDIRGNKVLKKS